MDKLILEKTQRIWKEVGHYKTPENLELEVELYKKLINIFHVGDYFYFIFNPPEMKVEYCSSHVIEILGYQPEEMQTEFVMENIHPDDLPNFIAFEEAVVKFWSSLPVEKVLKYKSRYDYRIKGKNGKYRRFLHQVVTIQTDEEGAVLRTFCLYTDISHLKQSNTMTLSLIGLEGEPSYIDVKPGCIISETKHVLTRREREILKLLSMGLSSKEIAEYLFLSVHTVEKHRKNMLTKTKTSQTVALIMHALEKGWL